jgi:condensin complex subunit 1
MLSSLCNARHFVTVDRSVREASWKIAMEALKTLCMEINDTTDCGTPHEKKMMNTTLKMWTYVVYQLIGSFENQVSKSGELAGPSAKGKSRRKKTVSTATGEEGLDWVVEEEKVLRLLSSLLDLDLHLLWDPPSPTVMDSYSGLVANCCYKIMENSSAMKEKSLKEEMFQILGVLVQKYNQTLSVSIKMVQLLQHFEHLVMPTALMLEHFTTKFEVKAPAAEIVREIGRKNPADLALDTGGTRQFATFLVEVSQRIPEAVYPSLTCLLPHLGYESYTMRNGVLGVLGEVLIQVLHPHKMNDEALRNVRDQCLDRLEDHIHDVNAFVRSKCLHIWQQLVAAKVIPVSRFAGLLDAITGRLHDKSSTVRKSAVQFLTASLDGNPYASKLVEEDFAAKLKEAEKELKSLLPEEWQPAFRDEEGETPLKDVNGEELEEERSQEVSPPSVEHESQGQENAEKIAQLTLVVKYLKDALSFTRLMSGCIPTVSQLLGSRSTSDVLEALEFLCTAQEFSLPMASAGMRKAMVLVWSSDNSVKEELLSKYTRLYLTPEEETPRRRYEAMCRNLITLTEDLTTGEQASFEELIVLMVKKGTIPQPVLKLLWEVFSGKSVCTCVEDSHRALIVLSMAGAADCELLKENFDLLVTRGLGTGNLGVAKQMCIALQKMVAVKKRKGDISNPPFRLPVAHVLFERLIRLICEGISDVKQCQWTPFAEHAIAAFYRLAENPDELAHHLLQQLASIIFDTDTSGSQGEPVGSQGGLVGSQGGPVGSQGESVGEIDEGFDPIGTSTQDTSPDLADRDLYQDGPKELNSLVLARFICVLGCVAHQQLIHLEQYTLSELKRRARLKEAETRKNPPITPAPGTASKGRTPGTGSLSVQSGSTGGGGNEEEIIGAAEDMEAELIHQVCEQELLHPDHSLLGSFLPLVVGVCQDPQTFSCPMLQTSAALTLSKLMLISSKFCDQNLQLLFTMLEKSSHSVIRANSIVALGDLTFRFPNLIEPWTSHLYARLSDESVLVRKNTMTVLSHLILNDMLKVKGQISAIALCLEDSESRIADLAKLFFHELAKKGNVLYNILPDIISRLSDPSMSVSEERFNDILKYLLSFIQKEKQSDMLVEKLCHRFRTTRNERQWREIAHCLAQLSYSERGVRKLQENVACYQDKLGSPGVYTCFSAIFTKCRKFAKPEVKALVDELEKRVEELHKKYTEGEDSQRGEDEDTSRREGEVVHRNDEDSRQEGEEIGREEEMGDNITMEADKGQHVLPGQPASRQPLIETGNRQDRMRTKKKPQKSQVNSARRTQAKMTLLDSGESEEEDYIPQSVKKNSFRSKTTLKKSTNKSTRTSKARGNKLLFSSEEDGSSADSCGEMEPKKVFSDRTTDEENIDPLQIV